MTESNEEVWTAEELAQVIYDALRKDPLLSVDDSGTLVSSLDHVFLDGKVDLVKVAQEILDVIGDGDE